MSAVLDDTTDAVAAQLAASDYGVRLSVSVVSSNRQRSLEELQRAKEIIVDVVGVECQMTLADFSSVGYEPVVDVFLIRKMKDSDRDENGAVSVSSLREMTELAQAIAETFMPPDPDHAGRLDDYQNAAWKKTLITPGYLSEQFATAATIVSQIRLTFTV